MCPWLPPRRAPIVLAATAAGLAGVLGYHPHSRPLPSAQSPVASAPAPAKAGSVRQLTGSDAPNQYGDVQVRVTTTGGRITQVAAARLPDGDGRSQQISSFAGPQLAQQALAAQSANVDGVSGATTERQLQALASVGHRSASRQDDLDGERLMRQAEQ